MLIKIKVLKIFLITLISIILTYYVAVLAHEYGHATTAWLFGYKSSPFEIIYGNWYLVPVSEHVNYAAILASGHGNREALIGITGISVTTILFLISLFFLNRQYIQKNILFLSFFFWLADINLMEMFSYLNRTFVEGDIYEFIQGLNIFPLWILIPNIILVSWGLYQFYRNNLVKMFKLLPIHTNTMRRIFLYITFWPLPLSIVYWAPPVSWHLVSNTMNTISLLIILFILISCDPSRNWIKRRAL